MRDIVGTRPVNGSEAADKAYVDAAYRGFTPPSGSLLQPMHMITGASNMNPASGTAYLTPFDVGPLPFIMQSIRINVVTAQAGGAANTTLGLYRDNGTGGMPLLTAAGLVTSGVVSVTVTGNQDLTAAFTLGPGRYWGAYLYSVTTAPTTAAVVASINSCVSLWLPNANALGTAVRGLIVNGLTALPTASQAPGVTGGNVPTLGLRAA